MSVLRPTGHGVEGVPGAGGETVAQFAADVQYYLMQDPRQLPSHYLYDDLGSALFDAITHLPWYRITVAEKRLLHRVGAEVFSHASPLARIVELGPGNGDKLGVLLDQRVESASRLEVDLVDISRSALDTSARMLRSRRGVVVRTHQASYEDGLREVARSREVDGRVLTMFLGSNIGNFDRPGAHAFIGAIRRQLKSGDALLLGADLVKPEPALIAAYDDPLGVTAAFNRNLLVRINRELGGTFDLDQFAHRAVWNDRESRVEMHLVARSAQEIEVAAASMTFAMRRGETIWTESSYKYRPEQVVAFLRDAGFRLVAQWLDSADRFALTLVEAA
jgi:L-histidine Nalpha-methyltransferase